MGRKKLNFDRTLVLRICDERLQARIREKMAAVEEEANKEASNKLNQQQQRQRNVEGVGSSVSNHFAQHSLGPNSSNGMNKQESSKIFDLAGVTVEPAVINGNSRNDQSGSSDPTLWNFICDGATYPARLTNLPCPVELHKTHDHAMYYKCTDVAQMLIVYEDMTALEEAESMPGYKVEGFPSYYHSGLTPPTSRIVSKRFEARFEFRAIRAVPPPSNEIQQVEKEILELMDSISTKDAGGKTKKNPKPALNKVFEEVEDVVVPYEPWMDDYGKKPDGVEFDENQDICKAHPEVWLDPSETQIEEKKNALDVSSSSGRSKTKTPTSMMASPSGKKEKSLTPDVPFIIPPSSSTSTTTKTKKKKTTTTKKKKTKKKSTKQPASRITTPIIPSENFSLTPEPDGTATNVSDLDKIPFEMNALDDLDFDTLDIDLNEDVLFMQ